MQYGRKLFAILAVTTGAALALAAVASAGAFEAAHRGGGFGDNRGGGFGQNHGGPDGGEGPGNSGPPANGQCLRNCQQVDQLCLQVGRSDYAMCRDTMCSSQVMDVQTMCDGAPQSTDCQTARTALNTCLQQQCQTALRAELSTCLGNKQTCRAACATAVSGQPDPQCVAGCRATSQTCRLTAGTTGQTCFAKCTGLITTAEQTCAANPIGSACTTALQAAQACVQPCDQAEQGALSACLQTAQSCVAACPTAVPTTPTAAPNPTPTATP